MTASSRAAGLRVEVDLRNEKINYKIREHSLAKAPVIAVVGRKEAETGQVALRRFGSDGQQIAVPGGGGRPLTAERRSRPTLRRLVAPAGCASVCRPDVNDG